MPYFAEQGYDAHAVSLRGHGRSEGNERLNAASIQDYVADVAQVAQSLPQPPVVIGHSMGGLVVQKYLERFRAPAGILMASCPATGLAGSGLYWAAQSPFLALKTVAMMEAYKHSPHPSPVLAHTYMFSAQMPRWKVERYAKYLVLESLQAVLDMATVLPNPRAVKTPMLVLGAANDAVFPRYEVENTARAYNAPVKIFPNMAHAMMLEDGWQSVAQHICTWLRGQEL